MKTPARHLHFDSTNILSINHDQEHASRMETAAPFPRHYLRDNAELFFSESCAAINNNTYSFLCKRMIANRCNKSQAHNYTQMYHRLFDRFRTLPFVFVEIGLGTPYQDVPSSMASSYIAGSSLRGWRDFFANGCTLYGGDIDPRILFTEPRIQTHYLNQLSPDSIHAFFINNRLAQCGFDVLLDDGLHEHRSNITLLISAWPYLRKNGLYLIEDMSEDTYRRNIDVITSLALGAECYGFELPSETKTDNRILALQKL
jgi:hypothetical protein